MLKRKPPGLLCPSLLLAWLVVLAVSPPASAQRMTPNKPCPCTMTHIFATHLSDSVPPHSDELAQRMRTANKARNYSLLGTLIPLPTMILTYPGLLIGPSLGYFYAGRPGRAWTGIGIRTLATGGMISSFVICGWDCSSGDVAYNVAWAVFLTSSGTFIGSAIYDIATVKGAVLRQSRSPHKTTWMLSPQYLADARVVGMQLRISL